MHPKTNRGATEESRRGVSILTDASPKNQVFQPESRRSHLILLQKYVGRQQLTESPEILSELRFESDVALLALAIAQQLSMPLPLLEGSESSVSQNP